MLHTSHFTLHTNFCWLEATGKTYQHNSAGGCLSCRPDVQPSGLSTWAHCTCALGTQSGLYEAREINHKGSVQLWSMHLSRGNLQFPGTGTGPGEHARLQIKMQEGGRCSLSGMCAQPQSSIRSQTLPIMLVMHNETWGKPWAYGGGGMLWFDNTYKLPAQRGAHSAWPVHDL